MAKKAKRQKKTVDELFKTVVGNLNDLKDLLEGEKKLKLKITLLEEHIYTLNSPKKIGKRFYEREKGEHILAVAQNDHAVLIDCSTGKRWSQPVKVKNLLDITPDEWKEISDKGQFTTLFEE